MGERNTFGHRLLLYFLISIFLLTLHFESSVWKWYNYRERKVSNEYHKQKLFFPSIQLSDCFQSGAFRNHVNIRETTQVPPRNIWRCPIPLRLQSSSISVLWHLASLFLWLSSPLPHTPFYGCSAFPRSLFSPLQPFILKLPIIIFLSPAVSWLVIVPECCTITCINCFICTKTRRHEIKYKPL